MNVVDPHGGLAPATVLALAALATGDQTYLLMPTPHPLAYTEECHRRDQAAIGWSILGDQAAPVFARVPLPPGSATPWFSLGVQQKLHAIAPLFASFVIETRATALQALQSGALDLFVELMLRAAAQLRIDLGNLTGTLTTGEHAILDEMKTRLQRAYPGRTTPDAYACEFANAGKVGYIPTCVAATITLPVVRDYEPPPPVAVSTLYALATGNEAALHWYHRPVQAIAQDERAIGYAWLALRVPGWLQHKGSPHRAVAQLMIQKALPNFTQLAQSYLQSGLLMRPDQFSDVEAQGLLMLGATATYELALLRGQSSMAVGDIVEQHRAALREPHAASSSSLARMYIAEHTAVGMGQYRRPAAAAVSIDLPFVWAHEPTALMVCVDAQRAIQTRGTSMVYPNAHVANMPLLRQTPMNWPSVAAVIKSRIDAGMFAAATSTAVAEYLVSVPTGIKSADHLLPRGAEVDTLARLGAATRLMSRWYGSWVPVEQSDVLSDAINFYVLLAPRGHPVRLADA